MSERHTARLAPPLRALAAGILIFFIMESAVARRVAPDIFLPVEAGAFLPGRLARLAACLVLGFALAMTERGRAWVRSVSGAMDRFCGRDRGRWALAALATALLFLWTLRVTVLSYMTMDDPVLMQYISQVPEKGLAAVHNKLSQTVTERSSPFSVLLCLLIGQFYRLDPDGYWYLGYHLLTLLVSFTVIGRCVLVKTNVRRWPAWAGCAVYAALYVGVLFYTASRIAFTVTAAVCGAAAVALTLCRHHESGHAGRVRCDILSGGLMVLCCMQRRATGYCLLCFWALALAYQVLKSVLAGRDGLKKRLGALALCLVMTLALIGGVFAATPLESDEQYRQGEYYRSLIGDYLKEELTPEQYARAGVGPELAAMIHSWCFMDRRITADLFKRLADIYYADLAARPAEPLLPRAAQIAKTLADTLWEDAQMRWQTGCMMALFALCLVVCFRYGCRHCWPELLCALCAAGGAALLLLYLIKDGRFLIRVFLIVSIPTLVTLLLTVLSVPEEKPDAPRTARVGLRAAGGLCLAALAAFCALGMYTTPHAAQSVAHDDVFALEAAVERYAAENSGKTIVSCVFDRMDVNTDPLKRPSEYPDNIVQWGYCGDLCKDPEERLYADDFFRDDVLFLSDGRISVLCLLQFMSVEYGPVQAEETAILPNGLIVYRFERIRPEQPDYTGWYEQNGMTFYFRDGQAVTGEQLIDGERYTFNPAGSEAAFGMSGPVFFLHAYDLTETESAS